MGAGAVGGYYGAALAERGHAVTFVARGEHLRAMRERGLAVRSGGRVTVLHPVDAVAEPPASGGELELVLFTVKGYDTDAAAAALRPALGARTAVLTLQNGVDSGERLSAVLGADRVLVGTTLIATTLAEPGVIEQANPIRRIELGEPSGAVTARVELIAAALRDAGVDVSVTTDVRRAVWEKFVRLAPGATLATACRATIGEVRSTPEGAALYRALIAETVAVGRAAGAALAGRRRRDRRPPDPGPARRHEDLDAARLRAAAPGRARGAHRRGRPAGPSPGRADARLRRPLRRPQGPGAGVRRPGLTRALYSVSRR